MKSGFRTVSLMLAVVLLGLQAAAMAQEKGYSHVRVVRLSFVDGTVLVRRPGSTKWAKASVNTPIEQGFSVSTSDNSYAEVEFENGSTARLGQLSQIDFTELALSPEGAKINRLTFDQGYGTFHLTARHGDVYSVKAGVTTLKPNSKAEFRADFNNGNLRVEVFDGSVEAVNLDRPNQTVKVTKDKALDVSPQTEDAFNVSHGLQKDTWDKWVHARDQQAELAYNDSAIGPNSPLYGWSDLDEYGQWGYFPGYGYGWSPFVNAGWSPFSMGQWSFYPGMGYTWISGEPWGWLPFHYGNWNYSPGFGYFWSPGSFNTFNPGLVTWFTGPGCIGWAARGAGGVPVCIGAKGCVTAVRPGTLQNGGVVDPTTRVAVKPGQITPIQGPRLAPGALAMLSGRPVEGGAIQTRMRAPAPQASALASSAARTPVVAPGALVRTTGPALRAAAPRIVIMGQSPGQAARMEALAGHHSFFSRSSERPLTAHMGTTLGGSYVVGRSRSHAEIMTPGSAMPRQAPVFLSRRSGTGYAAPRYQMTRGGAIQMRSGGMRAPSPSYGGGYHGAVGAAPSAPSVRENAPMRTSAGHTISSAPSGGPRR
ncbi:MAG: DUF6600 domain-containing protein [Terriglobia bacterium]